jgi:isoquinoline 1-oxidoreductase
LLFIAKTFTMNKKTTNRTPSNRSISRRNFLRISGTGLFIFFAPPVFSGNENPQNRRSYPTDFNAYLKIDENNRVSLICSKIEMGQGIYTSMAQMLAEELDVALDSIDMVMGDTSLCPWDSGTTGSRSTKYYGPPLRKAGAEARAVLVAMAADKFGVTAKSLVVENGIIRDKTNQKNKISYGELVKGKRIERSIPNVPIKTISEHTISGKSMLRTDALQKVTGQAKFAGDIRLPGMLYARVLRPPSHGAQLQSVELSKAKSVKGANVIKEEDNLVAVVHKNPEIAEKALSLIQANWKENEAKYDNQSVFDYLKKAAPNGRIHTEQGSILQGKTGANKQVESEFYNHYVAHSPLEPYTVIAEVKNDAATVWASTQAPFRVRSTAAETLNMPEENVRVITPFLGGGFGGKKSGQQIREVVRLSQLTNRPVQLAWSRKEEFFYDAYRPAALVQLKSGLDNQGRITFWDCEILFTGSRSSEPIYNIPHYSVKTRSSGRVHPFNTGAWRGPGSNTNVFAMESHTDELALAAGLNPFDFRMKNLSDKRMIRVLREVADKFGKQFKTGPSGLGYGIACTNYLNTYVATIAHVEVNKSTGDVKVKRVVSAQDMGEIINPQGAKLQIEGGITMGISAALFEEIEFSGGQIKTENFGSYRITRFSDVPEIEAVLIENPEIAPQGCGEPAITTIGAALANAIFDAVGARVYTLPMTPERIRAAIGK